MRRPQRFLAFSLLSVLALACERATQQAPNQTAIQTRPAVAAPGVAPSDSDAMPVGDSTSMPQDTADTAFRTDHAKATRALLETQLSKDQFLSLDTTRAYGSPCLNPIVVQTPKPEIAFVFVRPRVLTIFPQENIGSESTFSVEVTRVGVARRDINGQWRGVIDVERDTLSWKMEWQTVPADLHVCGYPGHANRSNDANGMYGRLGEAWLPINSANTEIGPKVIWDGNMTWAKLRQFADSLSKLPATHVVEGNPEPEVPIYYRTVCPGEGCEFGEWLTCDTISVLSAPKQGARVAFKLRRGDKFTAVTGDVVVAQAGMVVFKRNVKIDEEGTNFTFTPADTLYPLVYDSEGFGTWYFRGKQGGGFFFFGSGEPDEADHERASERGYAIVRPIKSAWWVKARTKDGREGWFIPAGGLYGMAPHYEPLPKACPPERAD